MSSTPQNSAGRISVNILGIDPGKSGGIALINSDVEAYKMPDTSRGVVTLLEHLRTSATVAFTELVGGYIGIAQPASSAFVFGYGAGVLSGALSAFGYEIHRVRPQTWQKALGLIGKKTESKTAWKNRLKGMAEDLFPQIKVTLATADALLIAEFGRRWLNGNVTVDLSGDES